MGKHDELSRNYEDALFALMMDKVAEAEGAKALEELKELNRDPEAAVPPETEKRMLAAISAAFRRRAARQVSAALLKWGKRAALWILMLIGLFTITVLSTEALREQVFNYIYREFEYKIEFGVDEDEEAAGPVDFTVGWVPEGMSLAGEESNQHRNWKQYVDSENNRRIEISVDYYGDTQINIDTEDAIVSDAKIGEYTAIVAEKENSIYIVWMNEEDNWLCSISSNDIDKESVINFAENINFE